MAKIIYMGTPQIAADVLKTLLDAGTPVSLVVTQPDRKVGRKQEIVYSPVKQLALDHDIPVFQPERIRRDFKRIQDEQADAIITCAYGQIVPEEVLEAPRHGCVNLHGSLLPEYRGAAPIQRAIWDGKTESGMALMKMEKGMDTGGVADVETIEITPDLTSDELFIQMGQAAGRLMLRNLEHLLEGKLEFQEQDESKATYAAMIAKEDEKIDFTKSDSEIYNQIRALSKTPGAWCIANGRKMKILACRYVPYAEGEKGEKQVFKKEGKKSLSLGLQDGKLILDEVQPEGKPAMKTAQFINGAGRNLPGTLAG